ncbi:hypothetical protein [Gaoshiqia sp. Z1-71]|uniref:hypothetical protein n=1 Tax=Gaoshiqia hydrogeniformans TaxID=3290090 RepID=UPI003BF8D222
MNTIGFDVAKTFNPSRGCVANVTVISHGFHHMAIHVKSLRDFCGGLNGLVQCNDHRVQPASGLVGWPVCFPPVKPGVMNVKLLRSYGKGTTWTKQIPCLLTGRRPEPE